MIRAVTMDYHGTEIHLAIKVKRIYGVKPAGDFRCYFDVELQPWGILIYACKLYQGDKGNLWARFPARTYSHNGQSKWGPVVEIEDAKLRDEIALCAREALQSA